MSFIYEKSPKLFYLFCNIFQPFPALSVLHGYGHTIHAARILLSTLQFNLNLTQPREQLEQLDWSQLSGITSISFF